MSKVLPLALALCATGAAAAQTPITFSELFVNPPGSDQGVESIELHGPASTSLAGYSILVIEGDGTGAGLLDLVIDLNAASTGANGLLLLRDTAAVLQPAPDAATTVVVGDFAPDIENGSNSYLLGFGAPPAQGTDLDSDNDGTLDTNVLAGYTVVDAVSIIENDGAANVGYADEFGGALLGPYAFTPDIAIRVYSQSGPCGWIAGDTLGTAPGPFALDLTENVGVVEQGADPATIAAGLGVPNPTYDADADGIANGCDGCPDDGAKSDPGACGCGIPEGCTLGRDVSVLSATNGGVQQLLLHGGVANANRPYLVLGSVSGTAPGLPIAPGVLLPLNYDFYLEFTLANPNTIVANSSGMLDAQGEAVATFQLPPVVLPVPVVVNHAYVLIQDGTHVDFASNAVSVTLEP